MRARACSFSTSKTHSARPPRSTSRTTRAVIEWDEVFTSEKQVEDVIWSMNEGTWCADNLLDLLGHVCDDIDGECLCQFTVVSIVSITDPD
jgi:hypothetical protein